jgi:hypothetical protein
VQDSLAKDRRKSQSNGAKKRPPTGATRSESDRREKTEKPKKSGHTHRSSKNAPQETSSKRAVTRKREVVEPVSRFKARDPRFDPAVSGRYDEHEFRKNYSFLDDYKDGEMRMLKDEIKETRDGSRAEQLAKKLKSMVVFLNYHASDTVLIAPLTCRNLNGNPSGTRIKCVKYWSSTRRKNGKRLSRGRKRTSSNLVSTYAFA